MRRGTTPTIKIDCEIDLTPHKVFVTIKQGTKELTITPTVTASESGCQLVATLTQAQTLSLAEKTPAKMQVRAINSDGTAIASNIMSLDVDAILLEGEISYE